MVTSAKFQFLKSLGYTVSMSINITKNVQVSFIYLTMNLSSNLKATTKKKYFDENKKSPYYRSRDRMPLSHQSF